MYVCVCVCVVPDQRVRGYWGYCGRYPGRGEIGIIGGRMLGGVGVLYYLETIGLEEYLARGCKRGYETSVAG